jgi:hypothetical protein
MHPDLPVAGDSPMSEHDVPPIGPLARLRAQLAGPRGVRRIDALLSSEDAPAAVAALAPNEIFELVHEVGFQDAQDLIELATPAQIQGCFDLDGWNKDQLEVASLKPWLAAVIERPSSCPRPSRRRATAIGKSFCPTCSPSASTASARSRWSLILLKHLQILSFLLQLVLIHHVHFAWDMVPYK